MALTTVSKIFGVDDIKIFEVTADTTSAYSIGTAVDVPGARQFSLKAEIDSKELTGDELTLDVISKCKSLTLTVEFAKLSLDMQKIVLGGSTSTTGSGATEKLSYEFKEGDAPKYFQFQAQIKSTDIVGGDAHFTLLKCKATSAPVNGTQGDFATFTFDAKASFTNFLFGGSLKKLYSIDFNATATDIVGIGSSTVGTPSIVSNIVKTDVGGTMGLVMNNVPFASKAAAELVANYTVSAGTTALAVSKITYVDANTVILACTGTAAAGTFSIIAKAAACASGVDSTAATYVMT